MYPWHRILNSWADSTGLRIDALGLVTLLGAEKMDRSIGRLVTSRYFDYLPLLGAYTVAGNRITEKKNRLCSVQHFGGNHDLGAGGVVFAMAAGAALSQGSQ